MKLAIDITEKNKQTKNLAIDDRPCEALCNVLWHSWFPKTRTSPICVTVPNLVDLGQTMCTQAGQNSQNCPLGSHLLWDRAWLTPMCVTMSYFVVLHQRVYMCIFLSSMCPPFPFGRICFVVLVMRKEGESSWSGPWHLATRTSSYSPVGPSVFFCVFSLGLYFVYSFVFLWFVCVSPSFYVSLGSWIISLTVSGASITNLSEPPRSLAASTIAWVRS